MELARARFGVPVDEWFVSLRGKLGVSSFGINLPTLKPWQRGRIHRHARQEEVHRVVRGPLEIAVPADLD